MIMMKNKRMIRVKNKKEQILRLREFNKPNNRIGNKANNKLNKLMEGSLPRVLLAIN